MYESFPCMQKKKKIELEKGAGKGTPEQDMLQGLLWRLVAVCVCCLPGSCLDPCFSEVKPPLVGSWAKWTEVMLFLLTPLTSRNEPRLMSASE